MKTIRTQQRHFALTAPEAHRVAYLDGLRGIAILAVVAYHYFTRWAADALHVYPYGEMWAAFIPFELGYYGVQLFFAVSGFVIAHSLERSRSIDEFAVRRFARLWPTMLLCSVISYSVLTLWPQFWPQSPVNFLPSLSFIDPQLWNGIFPNLNSGWIDGAYWTLFVEVRFYALAALIYFLQPTKFHRNFSLFAAVVVALHAGLRAFGQPYWADLIQRVFVASYLPWFLLGIAALHSLRNARAKAQGTVLLAGVCLLTLVAAGESKLDIVAFIVVNALLLLPQKNPILNLVLSWRHLTGIGVVSYSLYLLHQNVGLTLIAVVAEALSLTGAQALPIAFLVGVGLIALSRQIFVRWESPLNKALVSAYMRFKGATPIRTSA